MMNKLKKSNEMLRNEFTVNAKSPSSKNVESKTLKNLIMAAEKHNEASSNRSINSTSDIYREGGEKSSDDEKENHV